MNWFNNISTRAKLFVSFGVMFVFLALLIGTAFLSMAAIQKAQQDTRQSQKVLFEQHFANAVDTSDFRRNLIEARAFLLTMMLSSTREEQQAAYEIIKKRAADNDEIIRHLLERNRDDGPLIAKIQEMQTTRAAFNQTRNNQVIPLIYSGKIPQAQQLGLGIQAERFEKMLAIGQELGRDATAKAQAALAESDKRADLAARRASQAVQIFLAVGVLALVVGLSMAGFLNRLIAHPLRGITNAAQQIAAGDLDVALDSDGRRDEVGALSQTFGRMTGSLQQMAGVADKMARGDLRVQIQPQGEKDLLGNAFSSMIGNLRKMLADVAEAVNVLTTSTTEISASTSQLAASATQTASAVTETTATVEEIRQTAQVASEKARFVSENAQTAARISQGGKKATLETSEGMARIREQMDSIGQSMMRLSEQSAAIGEIIAVVDDLAQQSNLLAVNAAIEAAKAGEGGKGFAVVAQEVKSLADQSKQATTQVRAILHDIQKATGAAVMATEQGSKAVEAGVAQSNQAGESIETLADSVSAAAQSAMQIAASSQQQLVGMDQMTLAMESIKQASMQNVDGARQLEEAARNLSELGRSLQELVGRYQI